MDDIINDETESFIHFPVWNLPDVPNAVTTPFERIGIYAERRGHFEYVNVTPCIFFLFL